METSEVPAEFRVTLETGERWSADCPFCDLKFPRGIFLYFGYLDKRLVVSGSACSGECARSGLWKKYVLSRLSGTLTQEPVAMDDGPHGDHAED